MGLEKLKSAFSDIELSDFDSNLEHKSPSRIKDNFTLKHMDEKFIDIINESVPEPTTLKLPKLKLPKLEKVNE